MAVTDLAVALAGVIDPVVFAKHCGVDAEDWQADFLRSTAPRVMLNASRQAGKSTCAALLALWTILHKPGSLVLVASPSERQSVEMARKVFGLYRRLGRPVPASTEAVTTLELETGSRLVALPSNENLVRGFTPDLVVLDEAARITDGYYWMVLPMLAASGGRLVALSTPAGASGWFHDAWNEGDWERHVVPFDKVRHLSASVVADASRSMPKWAFDAEFNCVFTSATGDAAFQPDVVAAAVKKGLPTWSLNDTF